MHRFLFVFSLIFVGALASLKAQKAKNDVISLVEAEKYFSDYVEKKGINHGYLKVAHDSALVFRPHPVPLQKYYSKPEIIGFNSLEWEPDLAMISKKGDLGFTSGPFEFSDGDIHINGHYLSVWQNVYGKWRLLLDASSEHPKMEEPLEAKFYNPSNYNYYKYLGPQKIKMRKDVVLSTDILLSKALKISGNKNLEEFYSEHVRIYFPGSEPILGKEQVLNFIAYYGLKMQCSPTAAQRAISGDLAYTYGTATFLGKRYNYVRIWKLDEEAMKWNIIVDMYCS